MKSLLLVLIGLCLGSPRTVASDLPPRALGLDSSRHARAVLELGIRAMGGLEALRNVHTIERDFEGGWSGFGQSHRPWVPADGGDGPALHERDHAVDFLDYVDTRSYESLTSTQYDREKDVGTDIEALAQGRAFHVSAYGNEKPLLRQIPSDEARDSFSRRLRQHPEGVLLTAFGRPETLAFVGNANEGSRPQDVISFADRSGVTVFLYFDLQTNLLTKTESLHEHPIAGDTVDERVFSEYRTFGKVLLPAHYIDRVGRIRWQDWHLTSAKVNSEFSDQHFVAPPDHWDAPVTPDKPVLQKVGDDVYVIRATYNVMFTVFRDFVLVLEAPLGNDFAEECLNIIAKTAPGKPIRLVATHFHYDHIAGIREYISRGASILTTSDAKSVIERSAIASHTLRPDSLARSPTAPSVESIASPTVIDDGAHRVVLYDFGPTDHAEHIIAAYFPKEKLLFEPDMWDVASKDFCFTGYDGVLLKQRITENRLTVESVVPVHGIPGTLQMLAHAIEVRERYNR